MSSGISFQDLQLSKNAFDMESLLTRAVHRVLSNNLYDLDSNNVEKPRVRFQQTNNNAQVRLVAEQLCRRVERRYERKMLEELEREKGRMERKLSEIREEYRIELEQKKKDLEHARLIMEEKLAEKERSLYHSMEIRAMEKDGSLSVQQKILENRKTELKIAAERLEKANEEFKKKMTAELETLRLEWEKLALKEAEMSSIDVDLSQIRIVQEMRGKVDEVMNENTLLRKKILMVEKEKGDVERRKEKLEEELKLTLFKMRDKESVGESILVKEILEQNSKLKEDLLKNEIRSHKDSSSELNRLRTEYKNKEDAHLLKIREQRQIIELMTSKVKHLTSEKNYLKQEMKEMRREHFYGRVKREKQQTRSQDRPISSSESVSSSESSSLSHGSQEISNIKKRMASLDHIAKQLDASVEMFTLTMSHRQHPALEEDTLHGYDDFCRGLVQHSSLQSSPIKAVDESRLDYSSPQKIQEKKEAKSTHRIEESREEIKSSPVAVPEESRETEYEKRLRERNEQLNTRDLRDEVLKEEPKVESRENPLFQQTSSSMADYMNLFLQPKSDNQVTSEIILPEEIHFDPTTKSDDDIDW